MSSFFLIHLILYSIFSFFLTFILIHLIFSAFHILLVIIFISNSIHLDSIFIIFTYLEPILSLIILVNMDFFVKFILLNSISNSVYVLSHFYFIHSLFIHIYIAFLVNNKLSLFIILHFHTIFSYYLLISLTIILFISNLLGRISEFTFFSKIIFLILAHYIHLFFHLISF